MEWQLHFRRNTKPDSAQGIAAEHDGLREEGDKRYIRTLRVEEAAVTRSDALVTLWQLAAEHHRRDKQELRRCTHRFRPEEITR